MKSLEPKVARAWREFAAASGIDPGDAALKRAFYGGVKWMDRCAGGSHLLSQAEFMSTIMSVKSELAEFSGQSLRDYLAHSEGKS